MRRGLWLLLIVLSLPISSAYADPVPVILIQEGALVVDARGLVTFDIQGTRDFQLSERGISVNAFGVTCLPCFPGDLLDVGSAIGGVNDQFGFAALGRTSFRVPDEADAPTRFLASGVVPALNSSGVLTVPFEMNGFFTIFDPERPVREFELRGHGTATVQFGHDFSVPPLWVFNGSRFDFAALSTPEPGALLLLSSGLAGSVWSRRRSRGRESSSKAWPVV